MIRRIWNGPLWVHALVLAIAIVAVFPFTAPRSAFTSDEGAYALQAAALRDGHWSYDYRLADLDPTGARFPIILTPRGVNGQWYPYPHHPLFPLALAGASDVVGETVGLHVIGLLAVVAAAAVAWLLAAELEARAARPAFWLVAASPVLVNGYLVWAHAPSAAVAGVALLAALRTGRDGATPWRLATMLAAIALGVLLRAEGAFVAGAAAVVVVVAARRLRVAAALPVLVAVATVVLERRWINAIVGPGYTTPTRTAGGGGLIESRVRGAWHVLFGGSYAGSRSAVLALAALLVLVVLVARAREPAQVVGGAAVAGALLVARWVLGPNDAITGLLVAWPVAVVGVVWALRRPASATVALLAGVVAFVGPVLATQYGEGGGLEWGGRFLSPAVVPLAAVGAAGLCTRRGRSLVAVAAVAALSGAMGIAIVSDKRHSHDRLIAAIARRRPSVVVTDLPALPRLAWRTHRDTAWWLVNRADVDAAVGDLLRAGRSGIVTATENGVENIRSK